MKTKGTYLQNDAKQPIVFGEIEVENTQHERLRGEPVKEGILCHTVCTGFCGTDFELMHMGQRGELKAKFPLGKNRLVNGHEGVVYVPEQKRFAIVLIRGGDSCDPTRYGEDESYFEYGCDQADGLMSEMNYYHPDMLLKIPDQYIEGDKIPLSLAKKLTFSDPYACMLFQLERMEDLGSAQNFRVEMAKHKVSEEEGRILAKKHLFDRVVLFGLGTTGIFLGDLIRKNYPEAKILYVSRSKPSHPKVQFAINKAKALYLENNFTDDKELAEAIILTLNGKATVFIGCAGTNLEHRIAFEYGLLGNNGIYNSFSLGPTISFKTMPFGFKNQLIFGSINFRQVHMEQAIEILCESDYDQLVELIDLEELKQDPLGLYENKIYAKNSPLKTMTIWNKAYVEMEK